MITPLYLLLIILSLSIYLAMIIGIFTYKKLSKDLKIIFYYTIIASIIGGIMTYLSLNSINNTTFYNSFALLEFVFFSFALWVNQKHKIYKWIGIIGGSSLTTLFIISFLEESLIYNNTLRLVEASLLIILAIIYLVRIFGDSFLKIAKDPFKYVMVGIFTYFSSSILILSAGNQTQLFTTQQIMILFNINAIFYTLMVLLISISFIKCYRR